MILAVVIPAYKKLYFEQVLEALAKQTDQRFNVYIGDDCSPENLIDTVKKFDSKLNITYHRFENNIGSKNLVRQWSRCIDLTSNEPWIWLFSDDDLIDKNCVERFYYFLQNERNKVEVYRFNNTVIDSNGVVIHETNNSPFFERSEVMAFHLLRGERGNSLADHIFSRNVYERKNGLIYTDYAQGADWAMSISFSKENGIITIPDAKFYWRYSNTNISSNAYFQRNNKTEGHLQFLKWISNHFKYLNTEDNSLISYAMIKEAAFNNFERVMIGHYRGFNLNYTSKLIGFLHQTFEMSHLDSLKTLINIKIQTTKRNFYYRLLNRFLNKIK